MSNRRWIFTCPGHEAAESSLQTALNHGLDTLALLCQLGLTRLRRMQTEDAWHLIRRSAAANYLPAKIF